MKFKILWWKSQLGTSLHFVQISNLAFLFIHFTKFASSSWIGLRKTRGRNNFQWSDNSVFDYSYWRYRYYSYSKYQCVRSGIDGKWETTNCTEKYPFTCKITRNSDDPNLSFLEIVRKAGQKSMTNVIKHLRDINHGLLLEKVVKDLVEI